MVPSLSSDTQNRPDFITWPATLEYGPDLDRTGIFATSIQIYLIYALLVA